MSRPTYSSANTATTLLSATSCASASDFASTYNSTALTTPDLSSPKKGQSGRLETIADVFFPSPLADQSLDPAGGGPTRQLSRTRSKSPAMGYRKEDRYLESPRGTSLDLSRGPSVKDRAREFEASRSSQTPSASSRPLPSPLQSRTASSTTTPLRINKMQSTTGTALALSASASRSYTSAGLKTSPSNGLAYSHAGTGMSTAGSASRAGKRVPVPSTVSPYSRAASSQQPDVLSPIRSSSKGSTRKMIQQWESLPATPTTVRNGSSPMTNRVLSRNYLDHKPLPVPSASAVASSAGPSTPTRAATSNHHVSPARTNYAPSPLYSSHLQTPDAGPSRKRQSVSPSGSTYSLSPSGDKRRKGKSPLKDMLNVFGGGIQAMGRRAKEKGKGMSRYGSRDSLATKGQESLWSQPTDRVGTNGLPGGIVYSDRMGDKEMMRRQSDPTVIRGSAVVYLIPTPCSSVSQWGSWLTSWAILHPHQLKITYCPVFQNPQSGNSTPKRILSGTGPNQTTSGPAVPFSSIPPPELGSEPDVELDMTNCVEVRSLRKEEVRGRGVPAVPEGVSTEVLEMVWGDGSKRYIGVEGVGGRLGWVSAIWDVLLACKPEQLRELPPPSPAIAESQELPPPEQPQPTSTESYPFSFADNETPSRYSALQQRVNDYETKTTASSAPPVQKVGDTWVAASVVGRNSGSEADLRPLPEPNALRDSVQRMFDKGPDIRVPSRSDSEMTARIKAWQPTTERELSIFSRSGSKRSQASVGPLSADHHVAVESQVYTDTKPDTVLSFDPNDLNPSRSASQVRRASTILGGEQPTGHRRGGALTVVEERSDDGLSEAMRAATHISHITFPKPTVTTALNIPHRLLTPIPSASETSTESGEATAMVTPQTSRSVVSVHSLEGSVLEKLDSQSSEHSDILKQVDGVSSGLQAVNTTLAALSAQTKMMADPMRAPVPRALEDRLSSLGLDVKGLENAIQLSNLAAKRQPVEEPMLPEINAKLDSIVKACEDILAMHKQAAAIVPIAPVDDVNAETATLANLPAKTSLVSGATSPRSLSRVSTPSVSSMKPVTPTHPQKRSSLNVTTDPKDEQEAGEEVAQIMAQLTGGSNKASPRLVDLQVLHHSAPTSPQAKSESTPSNEPVIKNEPGIDALTQSVNQLLADVKEMKDARATEIQQNTDIARYLKDVNAWLEKNAESNSKAFAELSDRFKPFTGEPATDTSEAIPGLPVLIADVHSMMLEQKRRSDEDEKTNHQVSTLVQMVADEREQIKDLNASFTSQISALKHGTADMMQSFAADMAVRSQEEHRATRQDFLQELSAAVKLDIMQQFKLFGHDYKKEVRENQAEVARLQEDKQRVHDEIKDSKVKLAKILALQAQETPASASARPASSQVTRNLPAPPQMAPATGAGPRK